MAKRTYKDWYNENREHVLARTRKYSEDHKEEVRVRHQIYGQTLKGRWKNLLGNAKRRGLVVGISFSDFEIISKGPCFYCALLSPGKDFVGIDRIDSSQGYLLGNVVPCCSVCNEMKMDRTVEEWIEHMKRVIAVSG